MVSIVQTHSHTHIKSICRSRFRIYEYVRGEIFRLLNSRFQRVQRAVISAASRRIHQQALVLFDMICIRNSVRAVFGLK